jgi:hypothetical protein
MDPDRAALLEIRRIVAVAMPPDSGADLGRLLGDLSGALAAVGLDPIATVEDLGPVPGAAAASAEIIPFPAAD